MVRKFLVSLASASLILAGSALAQQPPRNRKRRPEGNPEP